MNAHGYSGPTPLTEVVEDGLTDFVNLLLEAGADPNIPNQVNHSCLFLCSLPFMIWELQSWPLSPCISDDEWNLRKVSIEMIAFYGLFMCQVDIVPYVGIRENLFEFASQFRLHWTNETSQHYNRFYTSHSGFVIIVGHWNSISLSVCLSPLTVIASTGAHLLKFERGHYL